MKCGRAVAAVGATSAGVVSESNAHLELSPRTGCHVFRRTGCCRRRLWLEK